MSRQVTPFFDVTDQSASCNPGPGDEYPDVPYRVVVDRPSGWRQAWEVLRGSYQPKLHIRRRQNLKMTDDILRDNYTEPISKMLTDRRTMLSGDDNE